MEKVYTDNLFRKMEHALLQCRFSLIIIILIVANFQFFPLRMGGGLYEGKIMEFSRCFH